MRISKEIKLLFENYPTRQRTYSTYVTDVPCQCLNMLTERPFTLAVLSFKLDWWQNQLDELKDLVFLASRDDAEFEG